MGRFSELAVEGDRVAANRAVTQLTDMSTAVTINSSAGAITTADDTIASDAHFTFTVTNSEVALEDTIVLSIRSYDATYGTNGMPGLFVSAVADGSFDITIHNQLQAANSIDGIFVINFVVIKAGPSDLS